MSRILALDFEGSNKEPRRGCPVQLGVAVMDGLDVLDSAEWLIRPPLHYKTGKPTREVDAYSLRISGLSLERIEAEGVSSYQSCELLKQFVTKNGAGSVPVVAYNFTYDAECYGQMLFDGGRFDRDLMKPVSYPEILAPKWICAFRMARRMLGQTLYEFTLDAVSGHFNLSRSTDVHGAMEDAILAGRVYEHLCGLAKVAA